MPASENHAAETSKDPDDRKAGPPRNIIRIRLPPRKRLSDVHITLSKKAPEETNNTRSKEVPQLTTDNPGKNLITAPVQCEASSSSPRVGLCNVANSHTLGKTTCAEADSDISGDKLPEEANDSTLSKNLILTAGEQGNDASSCLAKQGLYEEANNNIPSMALPPLVKELPEDPIDNTSSKNLTTTEVQGEENNNSPRKKLLDDTDRNNPSKVVHEEANNPSRNLTITAVMCEEVFEQANNPIPTQKLSDEAKNNAPNNRPTDPANKITPLKKLRMSAVEATGTSQNTYGMKLSTSVGQAVEKSTNAENLEAIKEYQEFEKVMRTVYLDNLSHQAIKAENNNTSRNLTTAAVKCEVFEQANNPIATKKLSDVTKNNALIIRPTDPAKQTTPRKRLRTSAVHATGTSQNTFGMEFSTSVGQAVDQSTNAANLEAIKEYQEFEQKVKRTVYLDNLSHQATEAVIKSALNQFGTLRKVSFVVNYTIPYNIPQSALVEMETEKDAEAVVNMLHEFPFMMSGMPRPVRAKCATSEMFNDRPRRPGSKLEYRWVGRTDPDYEILKKLKLMSRRHEVENLALIEHELEEEKLLAEQQQENLNCNYRMLETMDTVIQSGMANHVSRLYSVNLNEVFWKRVDCHGHLLHSLSTNL